MVPDTMNALAWPRKHLDGECQRGSQCLRRAWAETGHGFGGSRIESAVNVGVAGRLGMLAPGYRGPDVWWHPSTEQEAEEIAAEVFEQLRTTGSDGRRQRAAAILRK